MPAAAKNLEDLMDLAEGLAAEQPVETCDLDTVRIPHISISVFRETDAFAESWARAADDRRLISATTTIHTGGFPAAIRKYTKEKTPDLLIVETDSDQDVLEFEVDSLAEVCDPNTRLIVVGHRNDIALYQKLLGMGVSNYMVYPITLSSIINAISEIYREPGRDKIGKITAVIGAKGGVGASTVAQGVALDLSERTAADVLLVDMDMSFGTSSLNLEIEPNQGLSELIDQAERLDVAMLDRVLVKRGLHLNLLSTTPSLENERDLDAEGVERILETAATHIPHIVLDLPHSWTPGVQRALVAADNVIVVAEPEIASLRNATAIMTQLKAMRPNDDSPALVLNSAGVPRRQEIATPEVTSILKVTPVATIPFDPKAFSQAASSGKMIGELGARKPVARALSTIAATLLPKAPTAQRKKRLRF